jgi:hypothetical protein
MINNMTIACTIYAHGFITYIHTYMDGTSCRFGLAVTLYTCLGGAWFDCWPAHRDS